METQERVYRVSDWGAHPSLVSAVVEKRTPKQVRIARAGRTGDGYWGTIVQPETVFESPQAAWDAFITRQRDALADAVMHVQELEADLLYAELQREALPAPTAVQS